MTPLRAIRAKCIDCCGGSLVEVRHCPVERCALHPYRLGKKPRVLLGENCGAGNVGAFGASKKPSDKNSDFLQGVEGDA